MSDPSPELVEIASRTPPDLWRRLLRVLRQAESDPPLDGREIEIGIRLDRQGRPAARGTFVRGPKEPVGE